MLSAFDGFARALFTLLLFTPRVSRCYYAMLRHATTICRYDDGDSGMSMMLMRAMLMLARAAMPQL